MVVGTWKNGGLTASSFLLRWKPVISLKQGQEMEYCRFEKREAMK